MVSNVFTDSTSIDRADDSLHTTNLSTWQVVGRLSRDHLLPRKKLLLGCFGAMLFSAITTGSLPFLMQQAADEVFLGKNETMLYVLPVLVIVMVAIKATSEYFATVGQAYVGNSIVADLRVEMFERLTQADLGWLQRTHSGRFVSSFMNDVLAIREAASLTIVALGQNILKVLLLTGSMFYMDWRLSIFAVIAIPLSLRVLGRQRRRVHVSATKTFQETGDLGILVSQTLTGIRVVKAYDREAHETERARRIIDRTLEFIMRSVRTKASSGPVVEALTGVGFALAILYGGYQGIHGSLTAGQFMGFVTAAMLMYQPMKTVASLQTMLQEGVVAANRVFGIIDLDSKVAEKPGALPLKVTAGEITFDDVSFHYRDGEPVLRDFSLTVPAGKRIALVGPSGSGKSTVLNLLLRFYDPQSGHVSIDGQVITDCTISSVRLASALVTQEPVLFDDTIRANIMYGSEGASEEQVVAAAKAAVAHDFIMAFPKGYDTPVGEAGNMLSGGQRQRIAFARAMLRDAPILLLDEPTSSLDTEAEAQIQEALDVLLKGRSVIMIAHRLSTVKKADVIHVMEAGRIVESGPHDELVARNGVYARLHRTQFGAEIAKSEPSNPTDREPRARAAANATNA
ncbi:ABC transporter ATP-binding protein [Microbaculum sp. FT89]|uniref:ABC transporter ATP-binding protein n=1 Tax=Microbaculum sp. FT89 TaxID=3447298 RepID=UPI003F5378C2